MNVVYKVRLTTSIKPSQRGQKQIEKLIAFNASVCDNNNASAHNVDSRDKPSARKDCTYQMRCSLVHPRSRMQR